MLACLHHWIIETAAGPASRRRCRVCGEEREALDWLNQHTDSETEFFGVVVELFRIDESRPAYKFEVVWYSFSTGKSGLVNGASFTQGQQVRVELYIDTGEIEQNKQLYDALLDQKEEIELAFGQPLTWERLDHRRASRVGIYRTGSIEDSAEELRVIEDVSLTLA